MIKTQPNNNWYTSFKSTLVLALPILFSHMIEGLYPFINTLMAARLGQEALAAAGLVGAIFIALMGFGWGIVTSIGILSAHHLGAKQPEKTGIILKAGMWLSVFYCLPVMVVFWNIEPVLVALGQDPEVVPLASAYFKGLAFGVVADVAKFGIFQYMAAYGNPRFAVIVHLVSLPILIALNAALIWGIGPFPELGMFGLGLGTAITYWFAFALMLIYVHVKAPFKLALKQHEKLKSYVKVLKEQIKLGAPIGMMFAIEITLFAFVAILMGRIGTETLAAHQIAMQMLGVTILMAFGFAEAVTILVGKAAGSDNLPLAKEVALVGIGISLVLMVMVAIAYWAMPQTIIGFDLDLTDPLNEEVIAFAIGFLSLCALFQIFDGARIVTSGALRGLKDSQYPMWVAAVSFWMVGLPLGYWLAFTLDWGGMGLWVGLILAVLVSLLLQAWRLRRYFGQKGGQ